MKGRHALQLGSMIGAHDPKPRSASPAGASQVRGTFRGHDH